MIRSSLHHYQITGMLGSGGMGEVYRATDSKLGRAIAIKVLPEAMASDPERLGRFRREAHVVAALNHPNIVTIHSVEEAEGVHFLTMELVEGKPLSELIPEHERSPVDRARWHAQLGDLDAAFRDLDRALEERPVWLPFVVRFPDLAALRRDPRFQTVIDRLGLR